MNIFLIGVFTVIIDLVIPPIAILASSTGQSPVLFALRVAVTVLALFDYPPDAVPLITYGKDITGCLTGFYSGRVSFFLVNPHNFEACVYSTAPRVEVRGDVTCNLILK